MALINGALQIGKNGITAAQAAMAVTGNNLTNAATPGYSRQRVMLTPTQFNEISPGVYTGTGVKVDDIIRQVDEALNGRLRLALGDSASTLVQQQALGRAESIFNELTEQDLSTRLNHFFEAWSDLQNQAQDSTLRSNVVQEAGSLVNFLTEMRSDLMVVQSDLDAEVRYQVGEASELAAKVAQLNGQIVVAEAGQAGSAAALRDQRDEVLRSLGEMINITVREVQGGSVNVFVGNDPLVQYTEAREIFYSEEPDESGAVLAQIIFGDNEQVIQMSSGKIHGLITARDDQIGGTIDDLDAWVRSTIYEVNRLHSLGQGLEGYTSVTSTNAVSDADASLAAIADTELPWSVENGIFYVNVTDQEGNTTRSQIQVQVGVDSTDTTLNTLAASLNAITGIDASVDAGGHLVIAASSASYSFSFSAPDDAANATDVLAVLGVNCFFEGSNGFDIAVNSNLSNNLNLIAAGSNGLPGNGDVAAQIALLGSVGVESFNNRSVSEAFTELVANLATESRTAQDNYAAADVVVQTLESERQSISGVSVDEEAINMIIFQRAFQGAARFVTVIDDMLDEIMSLV